MKHQTSTPQGQQPPSCEWAAGVATDVQTRIDTAQRQREAVEAAAARLTAAVVTEGLLWLARLEAELNAAAAAFNTRIGRAVITVVRAPSGRLIFTVSGEEGNASVVVMPLLQTGYQAPKPGATVSITRYGCTNVTPFDFDLADDRLCMRRAGDSLGPEAFAQAILTPFLAGLALGGR